MFICYWSLEVRLRFKSSLMNSVIPPSLLHHVQLVSLSTSLDCFVLCFSASASFPSIHSIDSLPHRQGLLGLEGVKCCRETFGFHCVVLLKSVYELRVKTNTPHLQLLFYCTPSFSSSHKNIDSCHVSTHMSMLQTVFNQS